jgi:chromosome segregation ATPase
MIFALGMLVAGLFVLVVAPAIWRRAMRLARTRIEAKVPLSRAEIDADKDQLRAGFAVANRRLEIETGRLKGRLAEETIAHRKRADEVAALARDKAALLATVAHLEGRVGEISGALAETAERLRAMTVEVSTRETRLNEQEMAIAGVRAELGAAQLMTEELRLEMVARQTEIGNLSDNLRARAAAEEAAAAARDTLARELAEERERLALEASRLATLSADHEALHAERSGHLSELERLSEELEQRSATVRTFEAELATLMVTRQALVADVENVRADRNRLAAELAARNAEAERLAAELEEANRLRDELLGGVGGAAAIASSGGDNLQKALSAAETEKGELAARLTALEQDLEVLRTENAELRRVAGAEWESEREDSRRLRERLNEIAAGVVRLTQNLGANGNSQAQPDGVARPIPLASVQRPAAVPTAAEPNENTLAERLNALQHAARH